MTSFSTTRSTITRYASLLACVLACALLSLALAAPAALADVRSDDIICGDTAEARGFSSGMCPSLNADYAILIDETGKVYYERNAHSPSQIASCTKIMTAIVAMEYDPDFSMEVVVSEEAAAIGESSAFLQEGDRMTMLEALTAMMVVSGNDAAESIATSVGRAMLAEEGAENPGDGECVQRFVQAMNDKAAQMGLEDTVFTNPHGLDDGDYAGDLHSTAADLAQQTAYAMQNPTFRAIVSTKYTTVNAKRDGETVVLELEGTDELLESYEGTAGVKTGYTDLAGGCFAGAVDRDGREFYSVVMGSSDSWQRFVDTQALWDWCFEHWNDYPLVHSEDMRTAVIDEVEGQYPVVAYVASGDWTDKQVAASIANPDAAVRIFGLDGNISQEAAFDVPGGTIHVGDKVGTITFKQRNEIIATEDLIAVEQLDAPDPLTAIGIWWQRLWGDDTVAPSYIVNETPLLIDKTQTIVSSG